MKIDINGIEFKNPIIAASGTFGFGQEYNDFYSVSKLGGICTKGLTLNPRDGNAGLRVFETPSGMLNSVGLQNPGVEDFIKIELPKMQELNTNIIANVGGATIEEYEEAIEKLNSTDIQMVELNISCPNVKCGGMAFGIKSEVAYEVVSKVRKVSKKPLMVKLSPNAENILEMAYKCCEAGADSLSLINTVKGMAIDIKAKKPVFNNIFAGLSGPAIKPIALRMVYEVYNIVKVPIIGLGGIMNWQDAIEFIMAGATAVQIGTVNFINPIAGKEMIEGIEEFMKNQGVKDMKELIGIAHND
ncbi:dihydroorotate dehydrogenase [Desnuesiella massiliensis]|uniref:dihydroorotate dehydrogenase n=1 Tax=Desnuesiella massiliensis TaxID=1650662 RepID=UPI0006E32D98|nr:dihydroorotate dehydrogenase [Desnuesiella massiliensis]